MDLCQPALIVILLISYTACSCPDGWDQFQNSCLAFIKDQYDWVYSSGYCRALGGHLARIEDHVKNLNTETYLSTKSYTGPVWVGGTDKVLEGRWVWTGTNQPFSFTDWTPGKPSSVDKEDCLGIDAGGHWSNYDCDDNEFPFICEMKSQHTIHNPLVG